MKPCTFFSLCALVLSSSLDAEESWSQFRGPTGRGHVNSPGLPVEWSDSSIRWKASLKGTGQSSPVIQGEKLFLTGASEDGKERYVMCLSTKDGSMIWEKTIPCANPEEIHAMNSHATPTCAIADGTVVAFFGPAGLHAFDLDGNEKWSLALGEFPGTWGIASSPIILDGKVIQNCDAEGPSRLVAADLKTGKIVWETPRETKPKGGWSTPTLIEYEGRKELILNGEFGVRAYNPDNGEELWFCEAFTGRGEPVPEFANGKLYAVNGKPGDTYCIKPGGSGNVTATHRLWNAPRKGGRDLPSPAVVDGVLLISSMSGIASAYDAETGEVFFSERLGDSMEIAAAPLVANGLIYFQTVAGGNVVVVKPGKSLEVVAVNSLGDAAAGEIFRAVPVPLGDSILLRSGVTLYCVGK